MTFGAARPLLEPPFAKHNSLCTHQQLILPHGIRHDERILAPRDDMGQFLHKDLQTPKLNSVHQWLWLAGLPRPARPLHRQKMLSRDICITENPDEHLVWRDGHIFIKPLPDYLANYDFWNDKLIYDETLHKSACGLLLSYAWLIAYRSDLRVAQEAGLLPEDIDYEQWTEFISDVMGHIDQITLSEVDARYHYGELRLSRLNSLYRVGAAGLTARKIVYGFMSGSTRYNTFFARNFGWIVIIFVYMSIVLSALQVALGITRLGDDERFQNFAYAISIMSMGFVAIAVVLVFIVWWTLFWFHLVSTINYTRRVFSQRAGTGPG